MSKILSFQHRINVKKLLRYFTFFFYIKSLKSHVFFTPKAYLSLGGKFSIEILDLYLDFMKYTVGKVVLQYQNCSKVTKTFPIIESIISFF